MGEASQVVNGYLEAFTVGDYLTASGYLADGFSFAGPIAQYECKEAFFGGRGWTAADSPRSRAAPPVGRRGRGLLRLLPQARDSRRPRVDLHERVEQCPRSPGHFIPSGIRYSPVSGPPARLMGAEVAPTLDIALRGAGGWESPHNPERRP